MVQYVLSVCEERKYYMSVADNFKKWFLVEKQEEPEEEDTNPIDNVDEPNPREEEEEQQERHRRYKSDNETVKESSYKNMEEREARNQYQSQTRNEEANRSYNNNANANNNGNSHVINANVMIQVVLVRPEVFTDAKQIADHLLKGKTVVLNLETANAENKRRIIDFIAGVAYAKGGNIKKVAKFTYIVTPQNVGFVGDNIVRELENIEGNDN